MALEQRKGPSSPQKQDNCLFCHPDQFPPTPQFTGWPGWEKRGGPGNLAQVELFRTENLHVIPDIFPVRPDGHHVLFVGDMHRTAYAQPEDLSRETFYILERLRAESDGPVIFAEHGAGLPEFGHLQAKNQSIYHRHAHVIWGADHGRDPLLYMKDELKKEGWTTQLVDVPDQNPVATLQGLYHGHPYLFFNIGNTALWIEDPADTMPSMVTQRKMHQFFSGREFNWKEIPTNPDLAAESAARLMNLMSSCSGTGLFTPS